uniref:1-deoxy-D-xylulose 5-phosphate reductoisomerase n=1 Tax=Solibacter usitatus (strain Ellin6076) TaxID=234267 RepID=DXR_SOLUE|nr:RecName: Full=1-deoxy-D-xylulose 5-phosphate reductoisomerase; Short=DXP reductoisomerase; AltName: Full=1-deoxyxylulose-5-phosphate reductoisomerase; AltName: Full=2-C-methyl-D-erythritol 4-phosphate synthase [Candidatus Solibacter usitatus Ellin6076]
MKTIAVLGSTGSIGTNTLDVVRRNRHLYEVYSLVAGQNIELLTGQILEFRPKLAVVASAAVLDLLTASLQAAGLPKSEWPDLLSGDAARVAAVRAPEVDTVISAIVGVAGLEATYEAVCLGKRVGLANKEVLVSGGSLVMEAVRKFGAELLPVDSEHNGAHQCLRAGNRAQVSRLILTASGGPFRNTPVSELPFVTPGQALNHPTWKMGNRITIDCATLMNKGFEVIEACWLFDFAPRDVGVVIHPQSTVHAMIEYSDGSVLAQISATDMRMPIQYALTYPDRADAPVPKIDWAEARKWEFLPPDLEKFPLLKLAYQCQESGGSATCILNAADEIAVEAFLQGRIGFLSIHEIVQETLSRMPSRTPASVGDILEIDRESRTLARELANCRAAGTVTA